MKFGLCLLFHVSVSSEEVSRACARVFEPLALATGAIAGACAPARVGVSRGQHAQQGRTTAGTARTSTPTNPGDSPGPFKPIMHRCVFLRIRFVHQTKPPQGETRPRSAGPRFAIPLGREEPEFLPARPSWHRIAVSPLGTNHADQLAMVKRECSPAHRPFTTKTAIRIIARSRSSNRLASHLSHRTTRQFNFGPRHFWRFNDSDDQRGEAGGKAISPQPHQN